MRTDFVHWYPLEEADKSTPARRGVYQVRVVQGLLQYPSGKSAMVHYGQAENMQEAVEGIAQGRALGEFLCRHQEADNASVLFDFVLNQFTRRFGVAPKWPSP